MWLHTLNHQCWAATGIDRKVNMRILTAHVCVSRSAMRICWRTRYAVLTLHPTNARALYRTPECCPRCTCPLTAGRPDGGLDRFGSGPPSELSLESGSSSPRGGARPLPPELNGLGAPARRMPGLRLFERLAWQDRSCDSVASCNRWREVISHSTQCHLQRLTLRTRQHIQPDAACDPHVP